MKWGIGAVYITRAESAVYVGVTVVAHEAYADARPGIRGRSLDPKASPENPIWQMVDLKLNHFSSALPMEELRKVPAT